MGRAEHIAQVVIVQDELERLAASAGAFIIDLDAATTNVTLVTGGFRPDGGSSPAMELQLALSEMQRVMERITSAENGLTKYRRQL